MADFTIGDYDYTISSGTNVSVKVHDTTKTSYEDVPLTVTYESTTYSVTSMSHCFEGCRSLTSAPSIPSSIVNMYYCFYNCTSLITPPDMSNATSVTNMNGCFYNCTSFNQLITIPDSVTNMTACFANCISFNQPITIPDSVTNMTGCFLYCTSFNQPITIPNSVIEMEACFGYCTSFNQPITIPNSVTNMNGCFQSCASFNQPITISDNVTEMDYCFAFCISFNQPITIPNSVIEMDACFQRCTSFNQSITIPNSVTNMNSCFQDCTSFDNYIYFLGRISNYDQIFRNIKSAELIPLAYSVDNISIPNQNNSLLFSIVRQYPNSNITLSTDICTDGEYIYNENHAEVLYKDKVSYETVPTKYAHPSSQSVSQSIRDLSNCFKGCVNLTSAPTLPRFIEVMQSCFEGCTSLNSSVTISDTVTNMGSCFRGCTSLISAPSISSSVTDMSFCFYDCTSLVTLPNMSNATSVTNITSCFENCESLTSAPSIPASVTHMEYCFSDCTNLTGIVEINSITLSSTGVFKGTTKLIVLKGTYPQLSTIADQYSNVYVYSLSDTITGERNDDILNLVTLSVRVNRFKAGSNDDVLSAINVYKNNNSSALLGLEWFTDDAADPQPDSTTWNQGEGWYLRDGNASNYIFVEQNNKQLDTTKTYYKALESFIMDESPKIFYTNIDSVSEDEATTFNIIVTDAYGEAATQYLTIPIAFYTMDVVKGGRVISFGQHATQDMLYKLLEEAPTDWLTDYNNYYQKDIYGNYIQLNEITAPSFETDTYYQLEYPDGLFNCRMGAKFVDMIVTNLIGEIKIYAGVTIPGGWLECDGTELNVEDYPLLFNAIGNTYGGDGITTFCLPDLRGRFPIGSGVGTASDATERTLGQSGGSERVTLSASQMPAHTHFIVGSEAPKSGNPTANDTINYYGTSSVSDLPYSLRSTTSASASVGKSSSTGGSESHGNMPPYLTIKYIIRVA